MSWFSSHVDDVLPAVAPIFTGVSTGIQKLTGLDMASQLEIGAGVGGAAAAYGGSANSLATNPAGPSLGPSNAVQASGVGSSGGFNAADLIGPVLGASGDIYSANRVASGQAAANASSLESAREQMAFQERMSDTAHQREVVDLEKAGINPVLSANSGASTPVGASIDYSNAAPNYGDIASKAVSSAVDLKTKVKGLQQIDSSINESKSRTDLNKASAIKTAIESNEKAPWGQVGKWFMDLITSAKQGMSSYDRQHPVENRGINFHYVK